MVIDVFNNGLNFKIQRVDRKMRVVNNAASVIAHVSKLKAWYPLSLSSLRPVA
jgi:hypothetical protein